MEDDSQAVLELKALLCEKSRYISQDMKYIEEKYSFLIGAIKKLESGSIQMAESLSTFIDVVHRVMGVQCSYGLKINVSFESNVSKNPDLAELIKINESILQNRLYELPSRIGSSQENISAYKNCLLTSVDCERTFSRYKKILRQDRLSFLFENLSKYIFIHCNRKYDEES